jgi:hypothetical protein
MLGEQGVGGLLVGKDLDVIDVADLLAGVDVNPETHA